MVDTLTIFSVVAGIIILGFVGEQFFKKTGIPVFVFLIILPNDFTFFVSIIS